MGDGHRQGSPHAPGHEGKVQGIAFSPDGTLLATLATTERCGCGTRRAAGRSTFCAGIGVRFRAFSPDGSLLATSSSDAPFGYGTSRQARSNPAEGTDGERIFAEFERDFYSYTPAFSPDGTRVTSPGWTNRTPIWDPATGIDTAR